MDFIHIVSFDVPYPPDYGGAMAVYSLLKQLHGSGTGIYLHVFEYNNRKVSPELESLCEKIFTYKRSTGFWSNVSWLPYIVQSRNHPELLRNLIRDDYPVLLEGVHSTYWLKEILRHKKNVFVRAHNIEWRYYSRLAEKEKSLLKKLFFRTEACKLRRYEGRQFRQAGMLFCFTENDASWFRQQGANVQVANPVFSRVSVSPPAGYGKTLLIHGNLSINDTEDAVQKILLAFKDHPEMHIVVAGKNPAPGLVNLVNQYANASLVKNPDDDVMKDLISNAHVHLCYTSVEEGFKMRLLSLLDYGRFILCNDKFCTEPALRQLFVVENNVALWPVIAAGLLKQEFSENDVTLRRKLLQKLSEEKGFDKIIKCIFNRN